jgi:pimeloyl-ACP methyl ester carboxylesterase
MRASIPVTLSRAAVALAVALVAHPAHALSNVITIVTARQGCLPIQPPGNMTGLVGQACNGHTTCDFRSPGQQPNSATRTFCSQGMEITFQCTSGARAVVTVPGDAWDHGPAHLACSPATLADPSGPPQPAPPQVPNIITIVTARQGCLDIQPAGNMSNLVASACDGRTTCSFRSPGEQAGSATRSFCTQGLEITYACTDRSRRVVTVPGDAWKNGPALLACDPPSIPQPGASTSGLTAVPADPELTGAITVVTARQGCLDKQPPGNMTTVVGGACNGLPLCEFKAPNGTQPGSATRPECTQQLEITYRCRQGVAHTVSTATYGTGDAWGKPPLVLTCSGPSLVATNYASVVPPPEPACRQPNLGPPAYWLPPSEMLDWTPTVSKGDYPLLGFRPPEPAATRDMYTTGTGPVPGHPGAPGSVMGANEGRLRAELRAAARAKDPIAALCLAAKRFTSARPASGTDPSDRDLGNAFADLAVTGRGAFANFLTARPSEATLRAATLCAGASSAALTAALDRAYQVAAALQMPHDSAERRALRWIAVSGEDDQPYLPVNVPGTEGPNRKSYPLFHIRVTTDGITVTSRYLIAHATPPTFQQPAPLLDMGRGRVVPADPLPALAPDAEVILFVHGGDSRAEEALDLTEALHRRAGHNWTVISMDLPSSGYADNLDNGRIGPLSAVACHNTPLVQFVEDFVVEFVNALDHQLGGQLKPRIRAVVGGSLGGNIAFRLGRRDDLARLAGRTADTPWITTVVPWSPASIWPSLIARPNCVACGCDTVWDGTKNLAVNTSLTWAGLGEPRFLPQAETPTNGLELRRELFYGGFDWDGGDVVAIFSPSNHQAQAQCWFSNGWACKKLTLLAARLDRHETYDANFRAWHWRLGAEQLAFSHQQNRIAGGPTDPLYLHNSKPTLLFTGFDDVCAGLGEYTRDVATKMTNSPGFARFMEGTGHSLDNEHPDYIATEIAQFLDSRDGAMTTELHVNRAGGDYANFPSSSVDQCRTICSRQEPCRSYTFVQSGGQGTCWLKGSVPATRPDASCTSGVRE